MIASASPCQAQALCSFHGNGIMEISQFRWKRVWYIKERELYEVPAHGVGVGKRMEVGGVILRQEEWRGSLHNGLGGKVDRK